jgi:O-antigen ligase
MKANVGGTDRILRIVIGLVLIALAATGTVGVWGWIGVVPLLTGLIRWCPLYPLFGISSCSTKKSN